MKILESCFALFLLTATDVDVPVRVLSKQENKEKSRRSNSYCASATSIDVQTNVLVHTLCRGITRASFTHCLTSVIISKGSCVYVDECLHLGFVLIVYMCV